MPRSGKTFSERKIIPLSQAMAVWIFRESVRNADTRGTTPNFAATVREVVAARMSTDPIPQEELDSWTVKYLEHQRQMATA